MGHRTPNHNLTSEKTLQTKREKKHLWVCRQPFHLKRKRPYIRSFYFRPLEHLKAYCTYKNGFYYEPSVKAKKKKRKNKKINKNKTKRNHCNI